MWALFESLLFFLVRRNSNATSSMNPTVISEMLQQMANLKSIRVSYIRYYNHCPLAICLSTLDLRQLNSAQFDVQNEIGIGIQKMEDPKKQKSNTERRKCKIRAIKYNDMTREMQMRHVAECRCSATYVAIVCTFCSHLFDVTALSTRYQINRQIKSQGACILVQ